MGGEKGRGGGREGKGGEYDSSGIAQEEQTS